MVDMYGRVDEGGRYYEVTRIEQGFFLHQWFPPSTA